MDKNSSNILIFTACLAIMGLTGCTDKQPAPEDIIRPVRSMEISASNTGWSRNFQGVVDASRKADLSFRVAGKLLDIHVTEGQSITEGQVIARLDNTDYAIQLKDREASFAVARADQQRAEKLLTSGAIARAELDALRAKTVNTGAQLETAKKNLEYTLLKAPFAGRVAKKYVDSYEEVSAKQEIVAIQGTESLLVKVELPESVLVHKNQYDEKVTFAAEFGSLPGEFYPLTLLEAASQPSSTQTYTVTFSAPYIQDQMILPGMSARVKISGRTPTEGAIRVPAYTVLEDNQGRFVYVVEPKENQLGTVHRREVTTGTLSEQGLIIRSGLNIGDRLITAGMSQMTQGMKVRLVKGDEQ